MLPTVDQKTKPRGPVMDAIISACRKSCKAKAHACCSIFFTSVSGYKKRPIGMTNKKDAKGG
jgi:hypothetical protein